MTQIVDPPLRVPAVDVARYFTREWRNFLLSIQNVGQASPQIISSPPLHLTNQHATLPVTPLTLPVISEGLYRISVYQQVTTVDPVSSSLTTTIGWTNNAVSLSKSMPAMTGNLTTTQDSLTWMVHVDGSTPITVGAVYASNTPGTMQFELDVVVESVGA